MHCNKYNTIQYTNYNIHNIHIQYNKNNTVAFVESGNLKLHYKTTRTGFPEKFTLGRVDVHACLLSFKNSTITLVQSMSEHEKSVEAALPACAGHRISTKSYFRILIL